MDRDELPRILLGTSPFVGAGQFGAKSMVYYRQFYLEPANIVKVIRKAWSLGVRGVQLLPYEPVVRAVGEFQGNHPELVIFGTVGPDDAEQDLQVLEKLNAAAMILHGEITDTRSLKAVSQLLRKIHEKGKLAGLATHQPYRTLNWLLQSELDYDIIMLPLNREGIFMDSEPAKIVELLRLSSKIVVAKKVLAAGRINPHEALEYIAGLGFIDVVTVGVASEDEAVETFSTAKEVLKYRRRG